MVTNRANVSNASAPPTSVDVPLSVTSSHSTIDSAPAAPAATAVTSAYSPRGHGGVSAPASSRNSAVPTSTSSGDRANQPTSGPWNTWARTVIPPSSSATSSGVGHRDALTGPRLDVLDEAVDARLDALEERLRVDAEEHDQSDQHAEHGAFARSDLGERAVGVVELAVEHPLVRPQQVHRGEDHAGRGDDGPPPRREERADQDEVLADEPVEPGQADRRQHHDHEPGGEDRGDALDAAQLGDLAGVPAFVDPADEEEQRRRSTARG